MKNIQEEITSIVNKPAKNCWFNRHKWTQWSEPKDVTQGFLKAMNATVLGQNRRCIRCNMIQERIIQNM